MLRTFTYLFGLAFTLVGVAGFLPNGHEILGVKAHQITLFHNFVHLSTGLSALYFAYQKPALITAYFTVFSPFYFSLGILGFLFGGNIFNLILVEPVDNLLHMAVAALGFVVGVILPRLLSKRKNSER
jgi:Domain of unknown function (DUF4383)